MSTVSLYHLNTHTACHKLCSGPPSPKLLAVSVSDVNAFVYTTECFNGES